MVTPHFCIAARHEFISTRIVRCMAVVVLSASGLMAWPISTLAFTALQRDKNQVTDRNKVCMLTQYSVLCPTPWPQAAHCFNSHSLPFLRQTQHSYHSLAAYPSSSMIWRRSGRSEMVILGNGGNLLAVALDTSEYHSLSFGMSLFIVRRKDAY